ncbi:MAG: glycoside hydrolase domain-containing protein, partial [Armatimonadia bacterium]
MRRLLFPTMLLLIVTAAGAQNLLPNPSFEEGTQAPAGWTLKDGIGQWEKEGHTGSRSISVTGDGKASNYWSCPMPELQPMATYRMSFWGRTRPGTSGGCFVTGPDYCNRDYGMTEKWQRYSSVFCVPGKRTGSICRLGQWTVNGTGLYDDVELRPVLAAHRVFEGGLTLGEGEEISGGQYRFKTNLGGPGSNYSRPLHSATASFNSSRWVFGPGNEVIYRQELPGVTQTKASVTIQIGWYSAGTCLVEAGTEPGKWQPVGQMSDKGSKTFDLPAGLFPAKAVYVRLRSPGAQEQSKDFAPGAFQVHAYEYQAALDKDLGKLDGSTSFLNVLKDTGKMTVAIRSLGALLPGDEAIEAVVLAKGPTLKGELVAQFEPGGETKAAFTVPGDGGSAVVKVPYSIGRDGEHKLNLIAKVNGVTEWQAEAEFFVPALYASNYGYAVASEANADLWWCEGTYKVSQTRAAPTKKAAVGIAAARNEYEPFQLVLRPKRDLKGLAAQVSEFVGPGGAKIGREAFTVKQVEYLKVDIPTDGSSTPGWWPDPLPELERERPEAGETPAHLRLDLRQGRNYPLWITVKVPKEARAGVYRGFVTVKSEGLEAKVPVTLQVYDFTMPSKSHLTTAWGFSFGRVKQYQNLTAPADQQKVFDLYMQDFREHRISPYNFFQLAPLTVNVSGVIWNGGKVVGDQALTGKSSLYINDDSDTKVIGAMHNGRLPVEAGQTYRLSWAAKAEPGQEYQVTLGCFDATGKWFSGRNTDLVYKGSGQWERQEVALTPERFPAGCVAVDLTLRPVRWSEKGERTGAVWFDDLFFGKLEGAGNLIKDPSFEAGTGGVQVTVDWTEFDKAASRYINEFGFNSFRLPVNFLGGGRSGEYYKGKIGPFEEGTPEYERLFASYVQELQNHLEQKGWLDEAYLYWYDEPEPNDYPVVTRTNERIHKYAPKLNRMLTEQPEKALLGFVDTWCPVSFNYDRKVCQERQALGEKVWWYVCCGPKAPYAGLFIDHGATDLRVWMWQTWQNKVEGCLIWESTWWDSAAAPHRPQNPWTDPMGRTPEGGCWGNGDGRFIYPANRDYPN